MADRCGVEVTEHEAFVRTRLVDQRPRALAFHEDALVDPIRGMRWTLDGQVWDPHCNWAYRFDAAALAPDGRHAFIYERCGTKGLLLRDHTELLREVDRSFYHAHAYELPACFWTAPDGRLLLVHCPRSYCRLDLDDVETGERCTAAVERNPADFFHSRLAARGRWLLDAGWVWHPLDVVLAFDLEAALADPTLLDASSPVAAGRTGIEESQTCFLDDRRILIASSAEPPLDEETAPAVPPLALAVVNLEGRAIERVVPFGELAGAMMATGDGRLVCFHVHPKLVDLATGAVVLRWPDLASGEEMSSIASGKPRPVVATDPAGARFAVADDRGIHVVALQRQ